MNSDRKTFFFAEGSVVDADGSGFTTASNIVDGPDWSSECQAYDISAGLVTEEAFCSVIKPESES